MNEPPTQSADSQHPWIGLASFTEGDREFFAGRGDEIEQLLRLVRRDTLTLLYGVSGLGKTSLLQAGLFPALRNENYLPVPIRLDFLESADPLPKQVFDAIGAAAAEARVDVPQLQSGETLWEYFHRSDNHFWSSRNELVTPLLAFDQFEEFFTLGRETADRNRRGSEFISELADLVENRPPAALRDDPARVKEFNFKPAPLKVLLSMREDYLGDLDYIRSKFRALAQNRLRLRPMGEQQAREVIALGSSLLSNGAEDRIVKYVAGASANGEGSEITVAPALLSLVMRELNERRLRHGPDAKITPDLLDLEQEKILEDFYLQTLKDFPAGVRTFVEDKLLTASGHRNSCALDDALTRPDVTQPILNKLVDRRLLAYEDRHNTRRVEITHDVLLPVIKASRDIRLMSEARAEADRLRAREAAQRRKQRITAAVAGALALTLIATVAGGYYAFFQEHKAYYRSFAKRRGFPVGIGPLSESEARSMPVSFLLVHKGMVRDGWKLHWKPVFRVQAVNGLLELTNNHSVFPYLWRGELESQDAQDKTPERKGGGESESKDAQAKTSGETLAEKAKQLRLNTVCQWEFVSTTKGEIIYEQALDRKGHMVYGLIYSPRGSGSSSTGLTRLVGPDGFPQFQRTSAAEYVEIHYDGAGWEDRIRYRDSKNLPAAGPDGAFGQSMSHNPRGQVTLLLSLDKSGRNVIDNAGNCGMEAKYDEHGWDVEERSVGPDLKPRPVKDGWVIVKSQFDRYGRLHRMTFHGAKGEPVVSKKNGYHGLEEEYDKHGNPIAITYLGLDGKPAPSAEGFAIMRSIYDARGNMTGQSYHGVNGESVLHKVGYHGWEAAYDEQDNQILETYLGKDGKPALIADGYATIKSTYDERGNVTRRTYHGTSDEPVKSKERGYYGWEAAYDEKGNVTVQTYLGADGKPAPLEDGYATMRLTYDSRRKLTRISYHDVNGEPVLSKSDGYHGWEGSYDEHGNLIVITYLGKDRKPAALSDGYAIIRSTYDERGNVTRRSYYDVKGEPVKSKKGGYHGWEARYDGRGNQIEITYLGADGEPAPLPDGYATVRSFYDARGNKTEQTLHGANGEPVASPKQGYHGWEARYDGRGNQIAITYFGVDGKPLPGADGYAIFKSSYDQRGNKTRETYYGPNGEPVLSKKEAYHGWEAEYDERGNQSVITYLGLDGKPTLLFDGYATLKATYDEHGKMTRGSYHGVNGEPVLYRESYHGLEVQYDDRGNQIATTYVGLDGKPTLLADGYATMKSMYDERGKETRRSYYGVNGEPVLSKENGYHSWEAEYDEQGNRIVLTYFDKDGKPMPGPDGYATVRLAYDSGGNVTRVTYHAANGDAVKSTKDGYYGWEAKYDEQGNKTVAYLGKDGRPIAGKQRQ
jgi:phage protein U